MRRLLFGSLEWWIVDWNITDESRDVQGYNFSLFLLMFDVPATRSLEFLMTLRIRWLDGLWNRTKLVFKRRSVQLLWVALNSSTYLSRSIYLAELVLQSCFPMMWRNPLTDLCLDLLEERVNLLASIGFWLLNFKTCVVKNMPFDTLSYLKHCRLNGLKLCGLKLRFFVNRVFNQLHAVLP